jgi:hypothetical protein
MATYSKRDQKIMDRLSALGYAGHNAQQNAKFKFLVRPFTTVGVDSLDLATWFEDEMCSMIKDQVFESKIWGIAIFPTISDTEMGPAPKEYVKYRKGEGSVSVGLNIEFSTWTSASRHKKLELLLENIRRSIERVSDAYLLNQDRERLIKITIQAYEHLIARVTH